MPAGAMKIMTFQLAGEPCAVELSSVHAVARADEPMGEGAPRPLELSERLGWGAPAGPGALLELRRGERHARLRVERLGEVIEVPDDLVREPPRFFSSPLLRGVVPVEGRLTVLLDPEVLLQEHAAAGETEES